MDKVKVLNKVTVSKELDNGCTIRYYDIIGKVYLMQGNEKLGAIRFDTYLSLQLKEIHSKSPSYLFREYRKAV